jgi:hypothetical protein
MPDMAYRAGWGTPLGWTLGTLALSWGIGRALSATVMSRVSRLLPGAQHLWVQTAPLDARDPERSSPWPVRSGWEIGSSVASQSVTSGA